MEIATNIRRIKSGIPERVKLVAVSKTKPEKDILEAYNSGQRIFGENKVQELLSKHSRLPDDIEWHMIGHLQSNKVRLIVPFVSLIHGADSFKLLQVIDKEAFKIEKTVSCLLQFYIAQEETKFGFSIGEAIEMLDSEEFKQLSNVRICGVMGMATFTSDETTVRNEFRKLKGIFERLKADYFADKGHFCEISMGMSDDYRIAIEEGSTMIRLGSLIFGSRNYKQN